MWKMFSFSIYNYIDKWKENNYKLHELYINTVSFSPSETCQGIVFWFSLSQVLAVLIFTFTMLAILIFTLKRYTALNCTHSVFCVMTFTRFWVMTCTNYNSFDFHSQKVNHSGNHWGIVLFWLCFSQKVLSQSLHNVLWLSQSQGTVLTFTLTFHKVKFSLLLSWFCVGLSLSQGSVFDSHSHKVVYFDFTLAVFWLLAFFFFY